MNRLLRGIIPIIGTLAFAASYAFGQDVRTHGYSRTNGTYVQPYYRTRPDNSVYNNYSTYPNVNPYTGQTGTRHYPQRYFAPHPITIQYGLRNEDLALALIIAQAEDANRQRAQQIAAQQYAAQAELAERQREAELKRQDALAQQQQAELAREQAQQRVVPLYYRKADDMPQQAQPAAVPEAIPAERPSSGGAGIIVFARGQHRSVPRQSILEVKRNIVRSVWPTVKKFASKADAQGLIATANDSRCSPEDVRAAWARVQQHIRASHGRRSVPLTRP